MLTSEQRLAELEEKMTKLELPTALPPVPATPVKTKKAKKEIKVKNPEIVLENHIQKLIPSVEMNKTFIHIISECSFGNLGLEKTQEIFKDGRVFSHFIEHWLSANYPLIHINRCKDHDFIDENNNEIVFDEKTFTQNGCKFLPSNMIGSGRKINQLVFEEKASKLIYCIVSNINFPEIKIKFIRGTELIKTYPTGIIPFNEHDKIFN